NNPALRDYLPSDWQKVYDSVRTGGYNGLSGSAAAIYDANKVFDACGRMAAGAQRTACEAAAVKPAQDKAFAGVPVTVIADVPAITNQIETMAKWKAQYDQMVSQINQMQKQYDAVTG
ncbi:hypothetical protein GUG81_01460, partial [Xanthomonas citri pv. citri]|nr:hypothetical protein [Xanthomonas citri pv. citri]